MSEEELIHYMREHFDFDDDDVRYKTGHRTGNPVGTHTSDGYIAVSIKDKKYKLHRLVWLYHNGTWPKHRIDHRNRHRLVNEISNLRDATQAQNRVNSVDVEGAANVAYKDDRYRSKPWQVKFTRQGQVIHQAHYATQDEALAAASEYRSTLEFS